MGAESNAYALDSTFLDWFLPETPHFLPEGEEWEGNVRGEPLVSEAPADSLCYEA